MSEFQFLLIVVAFDDEFEAIVRTRVVLRLAEEALIEEP